MKMLIFVRPFNWSRIEMNGRERNFSGIVVIGFASTGDCLYFIFLFLLWMDYGYGVWLRTSFFTSGNTLHTWIISYRPLDLEHSSLDWRNRIIKDKTIYHDSHLVSFLYHIISLYVYLHDIAYGIKNEINEIKNKKIV